MKKYNKEVVAYYSKHIDYEYFEVFVLDGGEYYDVHVVDETYKDDESNTLRLQKPKDCVNAEYFTNARMVEYLMEHFIWGRFYDDFGAACISVKIESEEK